MEPSRVHAPGMTVQEIEDFLELLERCGKSLTEVDVSPLTEEAGLILCLEDAVSTPADVCVIRGRREQMHVMDRTLPSGYNFLEGADGDVLVALARMSDDGQWDASMPAFSVMMPLYNHEAFVGEALGALFAQTYPLWDVIVVDDGSTDNSAAVVAECARADPRIQLYRQPNGGAAAALNAALERVSGDWIGWLSSDDLYLPNKLALHTAFIRCTAGQHLFQATKFSTFTDKPERQAPDERRLIWGYAPQHLQQAITASGCYINGITVIMNRRLTASVGYFDEARRFTQDIEYWCRILRLEPSVFLPAITSLTRLGEQQTTYHNELRRIPELVEVFAAQLASLKVQAEDAPNTGRRYALEMACALMEAANTEIAELCKFGFRHLYMVKAAMLLGPFVESTAELRRVRRDLYQASLATLYSRPRAAVVAEVCGLLERKLAGQKLDFPGWGEICRQLIARPELTDATAQFEERRRQNRRKNEGRDKIRQ